jgi:hypothetical protein
MQQNMLKIESESPVDPAKVEKLFQSSQQQNYVQTDRMFAVGINRP